ncbi:hypothetical protein BH10PLA1_BH10PLA1_09480 [soil metagenome]
MDFQNSPIAVSPIPDGLRVALLGPIYTNVAWLESAIAKILATKPKLIELDLSKVPFVSSMGLGTLVSFRNAILAIQGELKTVSIQSPVLGTVKHAYLQDLLKIDATTEVVKPISRTL